MMKLINKILCKHYYQHIGTYDVFKDIMVYTDTYQYSYDLIKCTKCGKEKQKKFHKPNILKMYK